MRVENREASEQLSKHATAWVPVSYLQVSLAVSRPHSLLPSLILYLGTHRWFAYGGDTAPGGKRGGYVDSAFFDYVGGVAAPIDEYHLQVGVYQANSSWGEYAGYSASIVGNKSIEWIRTVA